MLSSIALCKLPFGGVLNLLCTSGKKCDRLRSTDISMPFSLEDDSFELDMADIDISERIFSSTNSGTRVSVLVSIFPCHCI